MQIRLVAVGCDETPRQLRRKPRFLFITFFIPLRQDNGVSMAER
jgi:hypothetical protein